MNVKACAPPHSSLSIPHSSLPSLTVAAASLTLACVETPPIPFTESGAGELTPQPPYGREAAFGPDNPPWGIPGAVGVWVLSFVFMFVTQLAFIIGYLLYRGVGIAGAAEAITKDPATIFVAIISLAPAHALTIAVAWLVVTKAGKLPFLGTLGWTWGRGFTFWRSGGLAVALLLTGAAVIRLTG